MRVILNVGCGQPTYAKRVELPELANEYRRARLAMGELGEHFKNGYFELDRGGVESTVVFETRFKNTCLALDMMLYGICSRINQDCVAVHIPKYNTWYLAGPHASEWGLFDESKFIMPKRKVVL